MPPMSEQEQDILTFEVKRSHFYAVTVPLAFLLGLLIGYLSWGQDSATAQVAADSSGDTSAVSTQAVIQPQQEEPQTVAEQIEALERYDIPITEDDPFTGPEEAPITLIEFADYECPFCQRHFAEVYPRLLATYPDQIRFVYKDFPLTSIHPNALPAALAAQCAREQDAFWDFHDLLFSGQLAFGRASYEQYASQLSLDADQFAACLDEERYLELVEESRAYALSLGIGSTPTFFINGIPVVGAQPFEVFAEVIDYELSQGAESN